MSIAEYAGAHGISAATVRRRIKAGEIAAHLASGPRGPEYRIPVSVDGPPVGEGNFPSPTAVEPTLPTEADSAHPTPPDGNPTLRTDQATQRELDSLRSRLIRLGMGAAAAVSHWRKARAGAQEAHQRAERLDGDLRALRLQLETMGALAEERAATIADLRARLDQAEKAGEQLRVLVQSSQRALEAEQARTLALETERRAALPASTEPPQAPAARPWWQFWRG